MNKYILFAFSSFCIFGCSSQPKVAPSIDVFRQMSCDFAYGRLEFHPDSATITAITASTLALVVEASQRCPIGSIRIVGISDRSDDELSRARVAALRDYMRLFDVDRYVFVAEPEEAGKMELQWDGRH